MFDEISTSFDDDVFIVGHLIDGNEFKPIDKYILGKLLFKKPIDHKIALQMF